MPPGPSMCSYKRAGKVDLGSPLQLGRRTFWRRENYGRSSEDIFIGQKFARTSVKYIRSYTSCTISKPTIKNQGLYTLFLFLRSCGNPYQWITCLFFHPPRTKMTVCLWSLIGFRKWPSSQPVRRISQWQILPSSSSNEFGSTLGYHTPSSLTETTGSSTPFGRVSGLCWTPSSQIHCFPPPN
jgi:hypothetical protein